MHIIFYYLQIEYNSPAQAPLCGIGVLRMNQKEVKNIGLRVSPEIHRKLRYIAHYEGRTINGQAYYLILSCIRAFEQEHGPIPPEDPE